MECIFNTHTFGPDIFDQSWREYYTGLRKFVVPYFGLIKKDQKKDRLLIRLKNLHYVAKPTKDNAAF